MTTYYCDNERSAAAWLQELIAGGQIPPGTIDEQDIREVVAADLAGYERVHLFSGIGDWELALQLAGWPAERPVWTASCPCQPFSAAGKQKVNADERHLWPEVFRLIRECRPVTIFGEQVEGAVRHGWLDGICRDLEGEGFAVGAAVLGAHSVGSPHIRQRLFWVAHRDGERFDWRDGGPGERNDHGTQGLRDAGDSPHGSRDGAERHGTTTGGGFWDAFDLIHCHDGKSRRVEPGTFPLAHGISGRVGLLRGYGNAIVPQVAAAFITAFLDATT